MILLVCCYCLKEQKVKREMKNYYYENVQSEGNNLVPASKQDDRKKLLKNVQKSDDQNDADFGLNQVSNQTF